MAAVGTVTNATKKRLADLAAPDVALVSLALCLAEALDDPETFNAATAREYRLVLSALVAVAPAGLTLDDLAGDDGV